MAVKAKAEITIARIVDIDSVTRYYLLRSSTASTPDKPSANPPGGDWVTVEPDYTAGATNTLYFVDCTVLTNGTFSYSAVSKSSSYEAAKEAYNKAANAQNSAEEAGQAAEELTTQLRQCSAEITKNSEQILSTVSELETMARGDTVEELKSRVSAVEQTATGLNITIESVNESVEAQKDAFDDFRAQTSIYFQFTEQGLSIGRKNEGDDSPFSIVISNEKMSFQQNGMEIAYIQYNKMHINAIEALNVMSVGATEDGGFFDFISTPQGMGVKWRSV